VSFSEIFFLGLLGLIVFGPKKLVSVGQQAGTMFARFQKVSREFQTQLQQEISVAAKDSPKEQPATASATIH
jgi:Sec-independent protein translocase protein TatA